MAAVRFILCRARVGIGLELLKLRKKWYFLCNCFPLRRQKNSRVHLFFFGGGGGGGGRGVYRMLFFARLIHQFCGKHWSLKTGNKNISLQLVTVI